MSKLSVLLRHRRLFHVVGFFDFYIIPLTKKLKECGVFGVSSGEYLNYAQKNRAEWEAHGEEIVANMTKEVRKKYGVKGDGNDKLESVPKEPKMTPKRKVKQIWC